MFRNTLTYFFRLPAVFAFIIGFSLASSSHLALATTKTHVVKKQAKHHSQQHHATTSAHLHKTKKSKPHAKSHHLSPKKSQKPKQPTHHAQLRSISTEPSITPAILSNPNPMSHDLATVNTNNIAETSSPLTLVSSMKENLVSFVQKTVNTLHYSSYKLGGTHFDTERGVYIVDCSNFVDRVLENVYPNAYLSLVNSTGADNPASSHYFDFFHALPHYTDEHWNKINDVEQLQAGDVLVFRYKNARGTETGGHVMVVMDKPVQTSDAFLIRIADSAPSRHSEDTRQRDESGIGIGTLLLKANPKTGEPSAFAWNIGSDWHKNVKFAMARPIDKNTSIG